MRKIRLTLWFVLATLGISWLARADFDQQPCFPLGGGACATVPNNFAVDGGQLTVRGVANAQGLINLHDRDATDDDDNARIGVNCTTVTSGAENCDLNFSQQRAGVSTLVATFSGAGTGDAALVLPTGSIGSAEIVDGALTPGDIADVVRSINLPNFAWVPCALETGGIWDASGTDAEPDLTNTPTGATAISYDATAGSVDTGTICTSLTVPADYASGGAFRARLTQGAATVTNIETFSCAISVDGATLGAANAGNNVNQTAVQTVTSTPAGTWAAGASIQVVCSQGNASADDQVNFHSIEAFYTATQ